MSIKLIAIGNRLMCDEGIAVKVAEKLKDELSSEDIEVMLGETDSDFYLNDIKDSDLLFILDATCYCIEPGTITLVPLEKYSLHYNNYITKHDFSLLNSYCNNKNASGYIIGIEIYNITFDKNLSENLEDKFIVISKKIKSLIKALKYSPDNMNINIIQNQINCLN